MNAFTRFVEEQQEKGLDGGEFDDDAFRRLFPAHWLNSLALVFAYIGFLSWLFCSPHMASVEAAYLDRTCGSFFTLNLMANLFVTGTYSECVQQETMHRILQSMYVLALFGMSIFGCNILCHRYLIEKAKTIMKL
jgi:hypothetical protein